jgi:hypothetical protein
MKFTHNGHYVTLSLSEARTVTENRPSCQTDSARMERFQSSAGRSATRGNPNKSGFASCAPARFAGKGAPHRQAGRRARRGFPRVARQEAAPRARRQGWAKNIWSLAAER